jgi:hypothetical protein
MLFVHRLPQRLGAIPEGDIIVLAQAAQPVASRFSDRIGGIDAHFRRWPVAGFVLIALAILLGGVLMLQA